MKRIYLLMCLSLLSLSTAYSQTFSTWGVSSNGFMYDTLANYGDPHPFTFSGLQSGAIGNGHIIVYYEGDFGDPAEFIDVSHDPSLTFIGSSNSYASEMDCDIEDSTSIPFDATQLATWVVAGELTLQFDPTMDVDFFCTTNRIRVRLEYDYCTFGTPLAYAALSLPTAGICPTETVQLSGFGTPAGGTYSGAYVSGTQFNATGLTSGNYPITYTYTDGIGCVTTATKSIKVLSTPGDQNYLVCEGSDSPILGNGLSQYAYATDLGFTSILDTSDAFVYGPIIQSPTTIYYAKYSQNDWFTLDTVTADNSVIDDEDAYAGDDRGGMAITDSTVYLVGDDNTVRYDLDLTNPVSLPVTDGLFSDLSERKLWSFYNSLTEDLLNNDFSSTFTIDALIALDADLNPLTEVVPLSQPIYIESYNSNANIVLAGYGKVGLYNAYDTHMYVIDINSGEVSDLGMKNLVAYWSENWASWGTLGFDGSDYIAYFRSDFSSNIVANNLTTDNEIEVSNFTDVNDMASFVYHPDLNRLYFHYEGSGQFGGSSETIGYIDATASIIEQPNGTIGCASPIEFTFNSIDLGADVTTCEETAPYVIEAGSGYSSYTWNGVNNNWNVFPAMTSGDYIVEVVDEINCVLVDTITVTFESCAGLDELASTTPSIYPVPNNGAFEIAFPSATDISLVSIFDMNGKTVWSKNYNEFVSNLTINAENLINGVYFVHIVSAENSARISMVVVK